VVNLFEREQRLLLDVSREKLTRLLSYFGSLFVFPLLVALVVGSLEHSTTIGIKTFLLIEVGMAVLSPLLSAVLASGERKPHRHQGR
jgi:pilus assembly protein TadC